MLLYVQIWSSDTGVPKLRLESIIDSDRHSILCINLSEDNKRLVGSATSGLVMVSETEGEGTDLCWPANCAPITLMHTHTKSV